MSEKFTEFNLSTDSYAAFDAVSLKNLIKTRLTNNNVFTDHIFEGSNLSSIIDIIAYSYHTLLFYLNRTSSESIFTESQLYENINRIVKLLSYNPVGYKTSVLTFEAKGNMVPGIYTIPRYSIVDVGGIKYSTNSDITFTKTTSTEEEISSIGLNHLLYQGVFEEYPTQIAIGEDFETFTISIDDEIKIDNFNINVFVKRQGVWSEYTETDNLFTQSPTSKAYEKRLNENKRYEIKFGNDIYGSRLAEGDQVAIYYLKSDKEDGVIGANALNGSLTSLTTTKFLKIREDIKPANTIYISVGDLKLLTLTNRNPSTKPEDEETVESIKTLAPQFFSSQNRLITARDFENYITKNFSNIILSTKVVSNNEYIDGHLSYAVNTLGLQKPNLESRILYNQVNFASSTNFNNVYIYAVPKFEKITSAAPLVNFVTPAQQSMIINGIDKIKPLTSEPVIVDPIYMAIDLGAAFPTETLTPDMRLNTKLNIIKRRDSQRDGDAIKDEAISIILKYFGTASELGYLFDISAMFAEIVAITDVVDVYMTRSDQPTLKVQGVTFLSWNPAYPQKDISIVSQNTQYPYYKFPYLYESASLTNKINVTTSTDLTTASY